MQSTLPHTIINYVWKMGDSITWLMDKITKGDLLSDLYSTLLTTGMIIPYGGTTAPANFLLCNGSTYSQGTYPALYAVIGTTYGTGAPGTFKVPNMTGVTNAVGSIPVNYIIKT
jgi:hypothetical protein